MGFGLEQLLGSSDEPPTCYLWVQGKKKEVIIADLTRMLRRHDRLSDYLTKKGEGGYVLKMHLRRYTPKEFDDFNRGTLLREVAAFMGEVYGAIKGYNIRRR